MSSVDSQETLAMIWSQNPTRRISRILFVTYRFNFMWFHSVVLPKLRSISAPHTEVLILATRNDDEGSSGKRQEYGDLYNLGEWAKWGVRFRRHYVPTNDFLLHSKFILIEWAGDAVR